MNEGGTEGWWKGAKFRSGSIENIMGPDLLSL